MSFLGTTVCYLNENFELKRTLLDMAQVKGKHTGSRLAKSFLETLKLYGIKPEQVSGITQDNASNCKTLANDLIESGGFSKNQFLWCFLHILNLACQAAIAVYDAKLKKNTRKVQFLPDDDDLSDFSGSEDSNDIEDPTYRLGEQNETEDEDDKSKDETIYEEDEEVIADELKGIETKSNSIKEVLSNLISG